MSAQTLFFALFGWLAGVLINHAADVLPHQVGLGTAPFCPRCGMLRPSLAWSAVLGYLSDRRLCLGCGASLPFRNVVVELVTPVVFVGLLWRYGLSVHLGLLCLYSVVLILVTITDLEHQLIQHAVMLPALTIALVGAFFNAELSARRVLLGGAVGLVCLFAMYLAAQPLSRLMGRLARRPVSQVPFGFGDVTLGAFVGLITGLPGVLVALFITVLSAGVVAALFLVVRALILRRYTPFAVMPYGPFLALGGFIAMVYGAQIMLSLR